MHHAALNRAGPHDGDLTHQIVELARAHAGQEVQLRPAFDLKDANRIGAAQHVIDLRIFGRDIGQCQALPAMSGQKIKGLADAGQHAQRQNIHLQKAQCVDVVLVPFDDGAVLHRGVLDGTEFVQPPLGDDKAADMLRQMTRKADDFPDQLRASVTRRSAGSSPASRTRSSDGAEEDHPQICPESRAITSWLKGPSPCPPRGWRRGCGNG